MKVEVSVVVVEAALVEKVVEVQQRLQWYSIVVISNVLIMKSTTESFFTKNSKFKMMWGLVCPQWQFTISIIS